MQKSALEQLATRGVITIQKKGEGWLVECVIKNEAGFLVGKQAEWGRELDGVILELLEKVNNAQ